MSLHSIQDTILWSRLKIGFTGEDALTADKLSGNIIDMCKDASDRMKRCMVLHKQYTLHDETHLLRVTEIMAKILGNEGLKLLNPVEITLLILSAYYHDIGMVMDDDIVEALPNDDDYKIFKENWIVDHPNYREIQTYINNHSYSQVSQDRCISAYSDLQNALLTDYTRINHGDM